MKTCIGHTAFPIRELSICRFEMFRQVFKPIPYEYQGINRPILRNSKVLCTKNSAFVNWTFVGTS